MKRVMSIVLSSCSLLLALIFSLTAVLSSCADKISGDTVTLTSQNTATIMTETEPEKERLEIPDLNFNGYEFNVQSYVRTDTHNFDSFGGTNSQTGEILNDSSYERNLAVEQLLNIKIKPQIGTSYKNMSSELSNTALAGDYTYDAICSVVSSLTSVSLGGGFYDVNNMSNIDLTKSWWDSTLNDTFSLGKYLYFASGDGLTINNDATYIVRYNQDMATNKGYVAEDFYKLVRNGEWTIDKMMEIASGFSADLNGDGAYTTDDQYGIAGIQSFVQALWYGCGLQLVTKDADNYPVFVGYSDRTQSAYDKIRSVFSTGKITLNCNVNKLPGMTHATTADAMLLEGRALFQSTVLESMIRTNNSDTRIGIMPIPKYDTVQDRYYCIVNPLAFCSAVAIPSNASDTSRTGAVLEAMMYYSQQYIKSAYFDTVFKYKILDDEASYEMLETILDSRVAPDLETIYSWTGMMTSIQNSAVNNVESIASLYGQVSKVIEKQLESLVDKLK